MEILYIQTAEKCLMISGKCGWTMYFLAPVKGTDREELDYDELYAELPEE